FGGLDAAKLLVDDGLVERGLLARQRADDLHLVLAGQVLNDTGIALEAPQDEWSHDALEACGHRVVAIALDGEREVAAERTERAKQARVGKLEDRPQLGEAVLDRRTGEREAVARMQTASCPCGGRSGVLDVLRFVQGDNGPLDAREQLHVA